MKAIIQSGGKQYSVSPGDVIRVEKLVAEVGSELELPSVLAVFDDDGQARAGAEASGARVKATVLGNGRSKKVLVFKFKRKKQYKRTMGHRQAFTELQVNEIIV